MNKVYLFTYGMLTNKDVMNPNAIMVGPALIEDWEFEFLNYANVRPYYDKSAVGVLWEINADILRECDMREGYPTVYDREIVPVESNGKTFWAWIYTLTRSAREEYAKQPPTSYYFNTVVEGYLQNGLSTTQLGIVAA
jgi:gamma-glutamylcyclotransferase (GGCT)/AIG2-like uncharacterized protein YtfP